MRAFSNLNSSMFNTFAVRSGNIALFRNLNLYNGHSIVAKVSDSKACIPSFMADEAINIIRKQNYPKYCDIICHIGDFRIIRSSTSTKIFNTFTSYARHKEFIKVETGKGYNYKGANGVILDGNYNPLMLCCNIYDIHKDGSFESISMVNQICMISPRVFTNTDLISKFIVKNIMPNVPNIKMGLDSNIDILITSSIDNFIHSAKAPSDDTFNDSIYKALEANIKEIIDEPQRVLQGLDESDIL